MSTFVNKVQHTHFYLEDIEFGTVVTFEPDHFGDKFIVCASDYPEMSILNREKGIELPENHVVLYNIDGDYVCIADGRTPCYIMKGKLVMSLEPDTAM